MNCTYSIGTAPSFQKVLRKKLESTTLNSIREVLPDSAIKEGCQALGLTYRHRILTPILTILHMILAALWPEESLNASWQVLWDFLVSKFPEVAGRSPNSGSVSKARARLPLALWLWLFMWLSNQIQERAARFDRWRGHRLILMDGMCVSMPANEALFSVFGTCNGGSKNSQGRYPLARLVAAAGLHTKTLIAYGVGKYRDSENELASSLFSQLKKGDLLIADRRFSGANLYAQYLSFGFQFIARMHQRLKLSRLRRLNVYSPNDFIAELPINKAYRKRNPELPASIPVRFICGQILIRGRQEMLWVATSLLDANLYPAAEILTLYGKRWRIETLFREIKVTLSADVLRSVTPEGVQKEIAAKLMAVNIVQAIILHAAEMYDKDPERISFTHAVRAIVTFAPAMAIEPLWRLPELYRAMLREIASHLVPKRPGRNEPRAVRREKKHYPRLRTTRKIWRLTHVA